MENPVPAEPQAELETVAANVVVEEPIIFDDKPLSRSYRRAQAKRLFIVATGDQDCIVGAFGPRFPHMNTEQARLQSFTSGSNQNRPSSTLMEKKEELADAGFFYNGVDRTLTTCFYCNGKIDHWCDEDNPFIEHAGQYPDCSFIKLSRGEKFIENCSRVTDSYVDEERYYKQLDKLEREDRIKKKENVENLREELNTNQDIARCLICLNIRDTMFYPCRHLISCSDCAVKFKDCYLCRTPIGMYIKAHYA